MSFTEVSLILLYLLQEARIPLNIEQISAALDSSTEYTYIDATISLENMIDKNLVIKENTPLGDVYTITVEGRVTLSHLKSDIRGSVRKSLSAYINKDLMQLSLENKVNARISILDNGKYLLHLRAYDKDLSMNDILICANDEEEAKLIMNNWNTHADEAIAALYTVLLKDN